MAWLPRLFGQSEADMIYYWVGRQLIVGLEVDSLFGPRWACVLLGRKSTHCFARSGPMSCWVGSQLIVEWEVDSFLVRGGLMFGWIGSRLTAWPEVGLYLVELEVNSLLVESEVDSSHVFSLLRGRVQVGVLEQTDISRRFYMGDSMRFYEVLYPRSSPARLSNNQVIP